MVRIMSEGGNLDHCTYLWLWFKVIYHKNFKNSLCKQSVPFFINDEHLIRLFFCASCKKKELHRKRPGSLRHSSTKEIMKWQPLKPGKQGLALQITLREMVALWWAVLLLVAHKKWMTAPFTVTSNAFFSLQDRTFKLWGSGNYCLTGCIL